MKPAKIQYTNNPTTSVGWNLIQKRIAYFLQTQSLLDYYYIIEFINNCTDAKIDVYCWDEQVQTLIYKETQYASSYPLYDRHSGVLVKTYKKT